MVSAGKTVVLALFFPLFPMLNQKQEHWSNKVVFALECDILLSPLSQLLKFPRVQSLLDRKYAHMDFLNESSTFPVICIYNVGSNILDSGARKVVLHSFSSPPNTIEVPLTKFIRNVRATWYAGRKIEKRATLYGLDWRIALPPRRIRKSFPIF